MKKYSAFIMISAVLMLALIVLAVSSFGTQKNEAGFFDAVNFSHPAQPLTSISDNNSYGQISLDYIVHLNDTFYDRFPFTFQEMLTAVWLVEELIAMGYEFDDIKVQEFTFNDRLSLLGMGSFMELFFFIDDSPFANIGLRPSRQSQNVILTVPGQSEEVIVVGAHCDSVFFPGASDNASGVALLLESAHRMLEFNNYYTIEYVFFGAEEMGLFGSLYYVYDLTQTEHDNIIFMINADILLDGDDLFYMAGYVDDTSYFPEPQPGTNYITETWDNIAQDINTRYDLDLISQPWGIHGPSDQLAFLPFGHTVMFLAGLDVEVSPPPAQFPHLVAEMARVVHSPRDDIHYIMKSWPYKAETNMRTFSIFLEEILLATYNSDADKSKKEVQNDQ